MPNINFRRRLMNGASNLVAGAFFDFSNFNFRTSVPQTQTRSFLETHVYAGGPKLTLKSNGLVGWNAHNWIAFSEDITNAAYTVTQTAGAIETGVSIPSGYSQVCSLTDTAANAAHFLRQTSGTAYAPQDTIVSLAVVVSAKTLVDFQTIEIFVANGGSTSYAGAQFNLQAGTTAAASSAATYSEVGRTISSLGGGFYLCTASVLCTGSAPIRAEVYLKTGTSYTRTTVNSIYITGLHVFRGVTNPGYVQSFATVPRLDEPTIFNTSGTRLGILLEPSATNSAIRSQEATGWTFGTNCAVTGNNRTAPDGTVTANRFAATSASGFHHQAAGTNGLSNGSSQETGTASIYVRGDGTTGATRTRAYIVVGNNASGMGSNSYFAIFDIPLDGSGSSSPSGTGVIGAGTYTSARSDHVGDGWYRIQVQGTNGEAATIPLPYVGLTNSASAINTASFAGTEFIHMWGMQYERLATVATSYIPTTTAAINRTADSCKRIVGPEWNATEGTGVATLIPNQTTGNKIAFEWDDATTSNRLLAFIGGDLSVAARSDLAGANRGPSTPGTATLAASNTIAFAWKAADYAASLNGGAATTSSTAGAIPTVTQVRFDDGTSGNQTNVRLRYFSSRLSNADVVTISGGGSISTQPTMDFNYSTGLYQYTPVNAGLVTTYDLASLISSGVMTLTAPTSAKWVRGSNGLLQQVAAGSLALEYDATGALLGCINTEPQRMNYIVRSAEFDNASWTKSNTTVTANQTTAPDGTATMNSVLEFANSSSHQVSQTGRTLTAAATTWSCWISPVGRQWVRLMLHDGVAFPLAYFDLTNGVVGTVSGGVTARMTWWPLVGAYRCEMTVTTAATAAGIAYICGALADNGADNYAGDITKGYYVWGAQLEAGSYASSYIPTTAPAVTRNADVWTLNLGSWFDNSRWIVASKVYAPRANMNTDGSSVASAAWTLEPASGTASYVLNHISATATQSYVENNGTNGAAVTATVSPVFPRVMRTAAGFAPSRGFFSIEGATQATTGTPTAIQASFTRAGLGNWLAGTNPDHGSVYIQNIQILPLVPTQNNVNQYAGAV